MSLDGLALASVKDEFLATLVNGRIDKIHQPEADEIILQIRLPGKNLKIIISANAQKARIQLTSQQKKNPLSPPMFCMVLRKHLEGGRIINITQPSLERILEIHVENYDELGRLSQKILVGEFMGKHSNILLIDPEKDMTILDGIKRYSFATSQFREVLPGRPYVSPPSQAKINPATVESENKLRDYIWQKDLDLTLERILLNTFLGLSPQSCKEIITRSQLPLEITLNECGEYELSRLWSGFQEIISCITTKVWSPTVVLNSKDRAIAFAPFSLFQYEGYSQKKGTISEVIEYYFEKRDKEDKVKEHKNNLLAVTKPHINRLNKKLDIYSKDLSKTKDKENLKILGELLTANLYLIKKGQKEIEVINYYNPEEEPLSISLDPQLSPAENAQSYYKRYNKAKVTEEMVLKQKALVFEELSYLESVQSNLNLANTFDEILDIKEELILEGYLKGEKEKHGNKKSPKTKTESKPMVFISKDGFEILVGKNNKQNDYISLRLASQEDIWFHTKDIPGSHVLIKTKGKDASQESIILAATLAAYFSKARESANVPVDYTLRKNVRKPKGAKPGMVIYEGQRTIYVTPEEKVVEEYQQ